MATSNEIFAKNLINLRKSKKITQLELSEHLNYSDRNVSKWENGTSLPTVETLRELSIFFEVPMDYFFEEHEDNKMRKKYSDIKHIKIIVICLSIIGVYLCSTICFVAFPTQFSISWLSFVWGLAASLIVCIVLYAVWFKKNYVLFIFISLLVWSLITACYLTILLTANMNLWFLFLIGIPLQLAVIFWSRMPRYRK